MYSKEKEERLVAIRMIRHHAYSSERFYERPTVWFVHERRRPCQLGAKLSGYFYLSINFILIPKGFPLETLNRFVVGARQFEVDCTLSEIQIVKSVRHDVTL